MGKTKHSQLLFTASALAASTFCIPAAAQQVVANGVTVQVPAGTVISTQATGVQAGTAFLAQNGGIINALGPVTLTTAGAQAPAIYSFRGGAVNLDGGVVTTTGNTASGFFSSGGTLTNIGNLTIRTQGISRSDGIRAENASTVTLNGTVDIATQGNTSIGLFLNNGSTVTANGPLIIRTEGNARAHGLNVATSTIATLNGTVDIATKGADSVGVLANIDSTVTANGPLTIRTEGTGSYGISAGTASTITLNGTVDVATAGNVAMGLITNASTVTANGPLTIRTEGTGSYGIGARDGSTVKISHGDITTQGAGAAAIGNNTGSNQVNTVSIANGRLESAQSDLVLAQGQALDVTLDTMTTRNGSGLVLNVRDDATGRHSLVNFNAINTGLAGDILVAADNVANVSLVGSTLTGAAYNATKISLDAGSVWTMTAGSTVSDTVTNAGAIAFASPGTGGFKTLTTKNYVGNNGSVALNTFLGASGSPSDRIVIDGGAATGRTGLVINNFAGKGAQTTNGIKVVDAINGGMTNADAFYLGNSDYVTKDGQNAKVAGAYAYTLSRGPVSSGPDVYGDSQAANDWYLRSRYQPGVPVYEAYPAALQILNRLPTLSQRTGDRYWREQAQTASCQDSASRSACAAQTAGDQDGTATMVRGNNVWARIEGLHGRQQPGDTTSRADYDYNLWKFQAGVDGQLYRSDAGKLIGGVTVHYGQVKTDISSSVGNGRIDTSGYGLGGTVTWYGANGFYLDAQGQVTKYESDLHSRTLGSLAKGNNGLGYALSLEGGKRMDLGENWTLTPQAQLTWSSIHFDSFTDPYGARVSLDQGDSLKGRLGLALEHERSGQDANGKTSRAKVYGIVNLTNEFLDGTRVNVSGTKFNSRAERLAGGIGLGGAYSWANDKYTVYAEVAANTSLKNFANSYEVGGTFGLRVRF